MENTTNNEINKILGSTFQKYRLKNNLTQEKIAEKLSKSTKTISQIETGKDGTSKKTDIDFMNLLEITPNSLYKSFITNSNLQKQIELSEKISTLSPEKTEALMQIIDIINKI